ncbi:hypothetical protein DPMN_066485 [Dreissena polymorpha]|uniref:Uncharacterized protein n=1 Tax=Dreissena polymorpha TaxID=45954 RepID=A0A9D4BSV3_DREPO|nr:hypothetical protein DPMN_066485 [Dreissena polymorpha]
MIYHPIGLSSPGRGVASGMPINPFRLPTLGRFDSRFVRRNIVLRCNIYPYDLVIDVHQGHQHNIMVTFIVLATVLGTLYSYMLSIKSSNGVWELPFSRELIGYGLPLLRLCRITPQQINVR